MIRTIYVSASTIKARCALISNKNENNLVIALAVFDTFKNGYFFQMLALFNLNIVPTNRYQL